MTSSTIFHHVIQIISQIWSCDQSLVTVAFLWKRLTQPQFYKGLTRKTSFFDRWSWFKFNNLGLALGTNLKFYTSVAKGLKLKVRKFWGLIPTFVEVTGGKLVGGPFWPPHPEQGQSSLKQSFLKTTIVLLVFYTTNIPASYSGIQLLAVTAKLLFGFW